MGERKELTAIQHYAASAAQEKAKAANQALQDVLQEIAKEIGADYDNERWGLSGNARYFERVDIPQDPPEEKKKDIPQDLPEKKDKK